MAIIKYAPFNGFEPFPALKAFEDTMNRLFVEPNGRPWVPPVDIRETENELVVKADIPDVKFEDIDVRMENGTLTVKGERKFEDKKDAGGWDGVKADYKNGTLTITLPKKEIAKPKQVKVQISNN